MYLDRPVDDIVHHGGPHHLDESNLHPGFVALIDFVGGVQGEHARLLDLGRAVENEFLDLLVLAEGFTKSNAIIGPLAEQVEGALGLAEPAHAVKDAAGAQALLGDLEASAPGTEQVLLGDADILVVDLAMTTVFPHHPDIAQDVVPRCIGGDDDHAESVVGGDVFGFGANHDGRVGGHVRAAGEPLAAVDHPVVPIEHRAGLKLGGVRTGHVGFGHGEARENLTVHQRLEIAIAPLLGGVKVEHDRILEGMGAQGHHGGGRAPDHFVDEDIVEEGHALAPNLLGMTQGPKTGFLGLVHQIPHGLTPGVTANFELGLHGVDVLLNEFLNA